MTELNFEPMNPIGISDNKKLSEIVSELKKITGVSIIGLKQYVSSTDGRIANRQIMVGANPTNAKMKDLVKLLKLSASCEFEGEHWIDGKKAKDHTELKRLADIAIADGLISPTFEQFNTDLASLYYTAWKNVINSIVHPRERHSAV